MAKNVLAICLMFLVASSVIYEAQGTFLLKWYLKKKLFPKRCIDFTPFACKGMLKLMGRLQGGCPATREFKNFFSMFTSYIQLISTSKSVDTQLTSKCDGLANAMSVLTAVKGRASTNSDFKETMMSMGKTLVEQNKSGSKLMTLQQKKELVVAMVKWTKMLATFLVSAAETRGGKSIDMSSLGLDVDVNASVGSDSGGSTNTGSSNTQTGSQNSGSTAFGSGTSTMTGSNSNSGSNSGSGSTYKDATGSVGSGSPSGSPTGVKGSASGGQGYYSAMTGQSTNTQSQSQSQFQSQAQAQALAQAQAQTQVQGQTQTQQGSTMKA